ncbi:flagellar biosynthesis protein FlgN [Seohaeicola saemankumensis]|uniref:Flagellar biosynthesis protein FlgN n=1 Tax=Seohaeicola saemankumensis TaxID=481181 RepID=A0ABW3TCZ1_9RHOB
MKTSDPVPSKPNAIPPILGELDDLLERERDALLAGDLEGLSRILREKEQVIDRLNQLLPPTFLDLDVLKDKALRNQALLDTALEGIRAVADRVSALRRVRDTLETYDQTGRKTTFESMHKGRVEKRA